MEEEMEEEEMRKWKARWLPELFRVDEGYRYYSILFDHCFILFFSLISVSAN
jgi:hypothetical protein